MESTTEQTAPQQAPQETNKDKIAFNKALKQLENLFNGDKKAFKKAKVKNNELDELAQSILAEDREEAKVRVKAKTKALLIKKAEYDAFIRKQDKEMEAARLEKMKEFTKEMQDLAQDIENIDALSESFANTFRQLTE